MKQIYRSRLLANHLPKIAPQDALSLNGSQGISANNDHPNRNQL